MNGNSTVTLHELQSVLLGALKEYLGPKAIRSKMEFSKKLIIGASFFYGLMCIVALISWFIVGDWPREIIEYFSWPFGAAIVSYMGKSAYENKAKIQKGEDT